MRPFALGDRLLISAQAAQEHRSHVQRRRVVRPHGIADAEAGQRLLQLPGTVVNISTPARRIPVARIELEHFKIRLQGGVHALQVEQLIGEVLPAQHIRLELDRLLERLQRLVRNAPCAARRRPARSDIPASVCWRWRGKTMPSHHRCRRLRTPTARQDAWNPRHRGQARARAGSRPAHPDDGRPADAAVPARTAWKEWARRGRAKPARIRARRRGPCDFSSIHSGADSERYVILSLSANRRKMASPSSYGSFVARIERSEIRGSAIREIPGFRFTQSGLQAGRSRYSYLPLALRHSAKSTSVCSSVAG